MGIAQTGISIGKTSRAMENSGFGSRLRIRTVLSNLRKLLSTPNTSVRLLPSFSNEVAEQSPVSEKNRYF